MDWIPRSPGRYHSDGRSLRSNAEATFSGPRPSRIGAGMRPVRPRGKSATIAGGLGCLRFAMKTIGGAEVKFLSASSTGMAHAGMWSPSVRAIIRRSEEPSPAEAGFAARSHAELRYWDQTSTSPSGRRSEFRVSTSWFQSRLPRRLYRDWTRLRRSFSRQSSAEFPGNFFAYTHIDPADGSSLDGCVEWMKANYVEARYDGRVLTDFDETTPRFSTTACPLRDVLDPTRPLMDVVAPLVDESLVNPHLAKFYIESLNIERWESTSMSNVTITGDGNVVGNDDQVVTTINRGLDREGLRELGEASALLRGEILQLDPVPEKTKNRPLAHSRTPRKRPRTRARMKRSS